MSQPVSLFQTFPVYKVEYDCILSKKGDVTLAYEVTLPEIFTLSDQEYEAFHQTLVKAVKVLPPHTIFHKQDWFVAQKHQQLILKKGNCLFFPDRVSGFSMNALS